jgi:NTE family protein
MTSTGKPAPRVAIACQGGGSHTAFTAGALKAFLRHEGQAGYRIAALSGTSGGAICAALAWYGLLRQQGDGWERERAVALLDDFWRDNSTQSLWEQIWNDWTQSLIRLNAQGRLPTSKTSPYSPQSEAFTAMALAVAPRREFFDLRALLEKYMRLDAIRQPVADPRLLIGAVAVLSGRFKAFDSRTAEISLDAVLASTTLPTLFKAVRIGDEVYWDGLFSQNPPVRELLVNVDVSQKPDEIWIVRINRQSIAEEPTAVEEIEDRRNALAGNLSLTHELDVIAKVNAWLLDGTLKTSKLKPITVRSMGMSEALSSRLSYVTKMNRDAGFLSELMADGEAQAEAFLAEYGFTAGA